MNAIEIGFSPCPNDTFIFYAMLHNKVDTEGLTFKSYMADVEDLNNQILTQNLLVSKISFHNFLFVTDDYKLLNSGSALGFGCGPLLISNKYSSILSNQNYSVCIPGLNTTANFLLSIYFPQLIDKKQILFSLIEKELLSNNYDLGLIIHENRFTYQQKGLNKIADLGQLWEEETGSAIPLGGIVVSNKIGFDIQSKIDRILKRSVEYAFNNENEVMKYVKQYSQEMEEKIMKQHIDLYVNKFTISLGIDGKKAIDTFFKKALSIDKIKTLPEHYIV
jgi:1,4-dihydroxy-6-naphthoate synthase